MADKKKSCREKLFIHEELDSVDQEEEAAFLDQRVNQEQIDDIVNDIRGKKCSKHKETDGKCVEDK